VGRFSRLGLGIVVLLAVAATVELPFEASREGGQSMIESEREERDARERALGEERPGVAPPEAVKGSQSSTTTGRAENPWNTKGRPLRGDEYD
jgi:hypothetical protein